MAVVNIHKLSMRCDLEATVRQFAAANKIHARPASHAEVDFFQMAGQNGEFMAREFAAKGLLLEKGRDAVWERSHTFIKAKDVEKMLELHAALEGKNKEKVPFEKMFYLVDPGAYVKTDEYAFLQIGAFYAIENPKFTVVENTVDPWGGVGKADPITKIAVYASEEELKRLSYLEKRYNHIHGGIWPLVRGLIHTCDRGDIAAVPPQYTYQVLISTGDADAQKLSDMANAKK